MLRVDSEAFLQVSREAKERVLHRGTVVEIDNDVFTVQFDDEDFDVTEQQEVAIFYTLNRKFVCQNATVVGVFEDEEDVSRVYLDIEWAGDYEVADSRQHYRVATLPDDATITFGGTENCGMADISVTGLAITCPDSHEIACDVKIVIEFEGEIVSGFVRIQSKRQLRNGSYRYGLHCVDKALQDDVRRFSMSVQRNQLQRMSAT